MRDLYHGHIACPMGCLYCFANIVDDDVRYQKCSSSDEVVKVIYPSCDTESLIHVDILSRALDQIGKIEPNSVISISTKRILSDKTIEFVRSFNSNISGISSFIKIAISLSNLNDYAYIEPGTDDPKLRLKDIPRLKKVGIPCSITVKPILPFVNVGDYVRIIEFAAEYNVKVCIGDLYVIKDSIVHQLSSGPGVDIRPARVSWIEGDVDWLLARSDRQRAAICESANRVGVEYFESDADLSRSVHEEYLHDLCHTQ